MSSGATSVWTRAMQAAITWRAFIAGIVTWPRARPDPVEAAEKAAKRAWTEWGEQGGVVRFEGVTGNTMTDLRIIDGSVRVVPAVAQAPVVRAVEVSTAPVMEVRRVLNDEAVRMCREAGREELVEYAWLARFEHDGTRHDQCSSGPLKAIRNSSHEMLRCKVLPVDGPRVVLVQMVKDGEVVYAFELDVGKPTWMVTARQCVEDALG